MIPNRRFPLCETLWFLKYKSLFCFHGVSKHNRNSLISHTQITFLFSDRIQTQMKLSDFSHKVISVFIWYPHTNKILWFLKHKSFCLFSESIQTQMKLSDFSHKSIFCFQEVSKHKWNSLISQTQITFLFSESIQTQMKLSDFANTNHFSVFSWYPNTNGTFRFLNTIIFLF